MSDTKPDLDAIEPLLLSGIRRDMERNPAGRGGEVRFIPATKGYGMSGCPGDNLVHDWDELVAYARTLEAEGKTLREAGSLFLDQRDDADARAEAAEAALSRWDEACDAVGIPRGDVEGFIRHHRGNAALIAVTDADTEARRTIQRVRDVHMTCREHPHCSDSDDFCHECGQDYPCLTIRVLDGDQRTERP